MSEINNAAVKILTDAIKRGLSQREFNELLYDFLRKSTYEKYSRLDPKIFEPMVLIVKNFHELLAEDMGINLDGPISLAFEGETEATRYYAMCSKFMTRALSETLKQIN